MSIKDLKSMTNEEFVRYIMNYNPRGALVQAFVIQALSSYCELVLEAGAGPSENGLINPEAWRDIASHINDLMEQKYGNQENQAARSA